MTGSVTSIQTHRPSTGHLRLTFAGVQTSQEGLAEWTNMEVMLLEGKMLRILQPACLTHHCRISVLLSELYISRRVLLTSHQDSRADVRGQQSVVPQGSSIALGLHTRCTLVMELWTREEEAENIRTVGGIHLWD